MNYINHIHICEFEYKKLNKDEYCTKKKEWEDFNSLSEDEQMGIYDPCDLCEHFLTIEIKK